MRNLMLLGMSVCLLTGCGTPTTPPQSGNTPAPSTPTGTISVTITDTSASFAEKDVPFPPTRQQLVTALGEPSRTLDKVNRIYVWDQQGIYAYSKPDRDLIHDISFSFAKEEWDYAPQTAFAGSITLGGVQITKNTTEAELMAGGFQKDDYSFEKSLGMNVVLIEHEGGIKSLSLSVP